MKYQNLIQSMFILLFLVSFLLPSFINESVSFFGRNNDIWLGWECAYGAIISISTFGLLSVFWSLSNLIFIFLLILHKNFNVSVLTLFFVLSLASSSYWWIYFISEGETARLLPGYWIWYVGVNGFILTMIIKKARSK